MFVQGVKYGMKYWLSDIKMEHESNITEILWNSKDSASTSDYSSKYV